MKARFFLAAGLALMWPAGLSAHPHDPHVREAPDGAIETAEQAAALGVEEKVAIVDGAVKPEQAAAILKALAAKPALRELKIYGATKWPQTSLADLKKFKRLEVLRIFDDARRPKPGFFKDISQLQSLKTLQLYYSGD